MPQQCKILYSHNGYIIFLYSEFYYLFERREIYFYIWDSIFKFSPHYVFLTNACNIC